MPVVFEVLNIFSTAYFFTEEGTDADDEHDVVVGRSNNGAQANIVLK